MYLFGWFVGLLVAWLVNNINIKQNNNKYIISAKSLSSEEQPYPHPLLVALNKHVCLLICWIVSVVIFVCVVVWLCDRFVGLVNNNSVANIFLLIGNNNDDDNNNIKHYSNNNRNIFAASSQPQGRQRLPSLFVSLLFVSVIAVVCLFGCFCLFVLFVCLCVCLVGLLVCWLFGWSTTSTYKNKHKKHNNNNNSYIIAAESLSAEEQP